MKPTSNQAEVTYHNERDTGEYTGVSLRVPVRPVPASRPRVTRWGTYYSKTYKAYKEAAATAIPTSFRPPLDGNLGVTIEFVCYRPKTTKLLAPRGDIDNHMKAILDAIVGTKDDRKGFINDDDQITHADVTKRYAEEGEEPHTFISIGIL